MKIIVAIDQSAFAADVLEFISKHRWSDADHFTVVHAIEPLLIGSYLSFLPSPIVDEIKQKAREEGQKSVHKAAETLRANFPQATVDEMLLDGFVVDSIVELATTLPADVIVIGSHGHRGINKFTLGSVARSISSQAHCSVLIVNSSNSSSDKKKTQ
ncbi:hypothetical protein BH11CYA1_BH11CYA1_07670 [soil metagenome]